jgi:nitrous oxidase accessory protein
LPQEQQVTNSLIRKPRPAWLISAIAACALLVGALTLPLWQLELVAPQYPAGLVMHAYGYKFADDAGTYYDDVREINGLNHYIGMKEIKTVTEMKLFVPGVLALMAGTILVSFVKFQERWLRRLIVAGFWFMPLFFVADLQYWLYHYGHTMNEDAALNTGSFTPKVFGTTKVWNFHSETRFELGFYCMVLAAVVITFGPMLLDRVPRLVRRARTREEAPRSGLATGPRVVAVILVAAAGASIALALHGARDARAGDLTLQQRIDAAEPGEIIVVDSGVFHEQVRVDKPLSLIGRNWPVIDGGGLGDVVTIASDDVIISGFEIRNSSRSVSQEPAAIKLDGFDRAKITGNRIRAAHFGIHMTDATGAVIRENDVNAGEGIGQERRGHGVYLWKVNGATVSGNNVRHAADGIHLEFSEDNFVLNNAVSQSRYALHFMYAHGNTVSGNELTGNLSGAVLMFSHELVVKDNEFSSNRAGATGAGMLLKDCDNLFAEGNRMLRNKYGMTVEGTPQSAGTTAIFRRNLIALNDTGVALTSNSPITFVENAVIDNTVQVKAMSANAAASLSSHTAGAEATGGSGEAVAATGAVWSSNGRGNFWSDYRGHDGNDDGVGDRAYLPQPAFAGRLDEDETLQLFQYTLAQQAIDMAADMFPVYRYDAVIEDGHPLMRPPEGLRLEGSGRFNGPLLLLSAALLGLSGALVGWANLSGRRAVLALVPVRRGA